MKCPECGIETKAHDIGVTLVGYGGFTDENNVIHDHDDNCLKKYYACSNGHRWIESLRRSCSVPGCDWKGKAECFCHAGLKVEAWTDQDDELNVYHES